MSLHASVVVKFESFKRFSDPVVHSPVSAAMERATATLLVS